MKTAKGIIGYLRIHRLDKIADTSDFFADFLGNWVHNYRRESICTEGMD